MLEVQGLCKTWGDPASGSSTEALKDFDVDVAEAEFVTVIGPSGCGKSTLLEIAAGLEPATSGTIVLKGRHWTGRTPTSRCCSSRTPRSPG